MKTVEAPEIAGYRIGSPLGEWRFGTAWRATQLSVDRPVEIRIFEGDPQKFLPGVRACSRLHHESADEILDLGQSFGSLYIVTERAEGETLAVHLSRARYFREPEALSLMKRIVEGLWFAHECGIAHGELRPENILVTPSGGVKILEFDYSGEARAEADLRDVGALFYQVLTGESPGRAGVLNSPRKPLPVTSAGVRDLVLKLLSTNTDDRPESDEALLLELDRISKEGPGPSVSRARRRLPPKRPVQKQGGSRALLIGGILLLASLLLVLALR